MTSGRDFGSALRRQRERQHITLQTIEQKTKISAGLLAALEAGDCSRWPAGIYSRAWIRDYAQAIGLDPDETAAAFASCFAETAFPGGVHKPSTGVAAQPPLRLVIEEPPPRPLREAARRCLLLLVELTVVFATAAALSILNVVGFWLSAAVMSLVMQAVGIVSGHGSAAAALISILRDGRHAHVPETSGESPLVEAT